MLLVVLCLFATVALAEVSSTGAVRIATEYLRHYKIPLREMKITVQLRRGPGDDLTDPAVRKKLIHRKHWWVHFTPNPRAGRYPDNPITIRGGAHSIYITPDTGRHSRLV